MYPFSSSQMDHVDITRRRSEIDFVQKVRRRSSAAAQKMAVKKDRVAFCWAAICLWNLAFSLDCTSIATALPTIAHDLSANSNQAFWAGTSFLLCSAAFQPVFTSLAQAVGRKCVVLVSLLLFAAGACVCGWGNTVETMLVGRCIQGVGGGGLFALTYVLMADLSTIQERGKWMGLLGLIWTMGTCCGPILGGVFTEKSTWRWIFWMNLPVCGVCLLAVLFGLSGSEVTMKSAKAGLRKMDWAGSVMFILFLTSFLVAISWGGSMYEWTSAATLVPLLGGLFGLAFWTFYEIKFAENPMIPIYPILANRTALICYLGTVVLGIGMYATIFFLPLYYQAVKGYSAIVSGVGVLPMAVLAGPAASVSGVLIAKVNRIKPFNIAGWIVFAIGSGLLTLLRPETSVVQWVFLLAPCGLGLGMLFSPLALATQAAVENEQLPEREVARLKAAAAGLNPFFRAIGQAFGITIAQSAFTNELRKRVGHLAASDAAALADVIKALPLGSAQRDALNSAFTDSLRVVWWICFALITAWIIPTLFTAENGARKVRGQSDVEQGEVMAGNSPCSSEESLAKEAALVSVQSISMAAL